MKHMYTYFDIDSVGELIRRFPPQTIFLIQTFREIPMSNSLRPFGPETNNPG